MSVITVSRQSGSEGNRVVKILCSRLGWQYFDKGLMAQLVIRLRDRPTRIVDASEDEHIIKSLWEEVFSNISYPTAVIPWHLHDPLFVREELAVQQVCQCIHAAYRMRNVIIVGRGSQVVLREKPSVLHVRVVAPFETRVERWMAREHIPYEQAKGLTHDRDRQHVHFVKKYFNEDIDNPDLYDLIINTAKFSPEQTADLVIDAAKKL